MSFLSLSWVQALVLLLTTACVIVFLYWLKPPPSRVVVASTLIWRRVLHERKRRTDFWRWLVSLLVALAVGIALASSIGRPEVEALSGRSRRIAVVVDNSPTMGARTSSGGSRWELALERARSLLNEGGSSSTYLVADTAGQLLAAGFTGRREALEKLSRLRLSSRESTSFPEGDAFRENQAGVETYFVTDGVLVAGVPQGVALVSVFEPVDNVGITAFDLRPVPAQPTDIEAFLELSNHSGERKRVALRIDGASEQVIERSFVLEPGELRGESFDLEPFLSGPIRALIDAPGDGFALDNVAYAYLGTPRRARVILVTGGNPYLETLLELDPRVALERATPGRLPEGEAPDLYVFDRYAPPDPPSAPALLFRPPPVRWLPPPSDEDLSGLSLAGVRSDHPLLAHVSFDDVSVESALRVDPGDSVIVAGTASEPLVLVGESPVRWAEVTFDIADSNLPQQSGFPIFLSNAVSWLSATDVVVSSLSTVAVPVSEAAVTDLDGKEVPSRAQGERTAFSPEVPGLFSVRGPRGALVVSANLSSPRVSAVNDSIFASTERSTNEDRLRGAAGLGELWLALVLVALLLLVAEWWTYHRRMTV